MAQANVGRLFIDLEARTARIEADLNKANQSLDRQTKRMKRTAERNMKAMTNVITGLVGLGIGRLIGSTINAADQIGKLSTRLGDSTEALSQYRLVAEKTGVEFKTLTTGIQRMTRRISEAAVAGKGEAVPALQELGLSAKALADLKPHEQFELLADAFMEVENQGDRVRLAMKLFDTEGVALLQTMEGGSAAIRELREQADQFGLTLSQDVTDRAAEFNDQLSDMKGRLTGLVQNFIPIANKIVEGWTLIFEAITDATNALIEFLRNQGLLDPEGAAGLRAEMERIEATIAGIQQAEELRARQGFQPLQGQAQYIDDLKRRHAELRRELEALTKAQEGNETQTNSNNRVLSDYQGRTEAATDKTKRFNAELRRIKASMRDAKVATDLFNDASEELDEHFQNLADRAQAVMDRLDPLAALTREYEEDVKALRDRFGDDEEGLTAALVDLDAEYEENKKRIKASTEEMRKQEEQARTLTERLQGYSDTLGSISSIVGAESNSTTDSIRQGSRMFGPEVAVIGEIVATAVDIFNAIFGGGGLQNSEIVFGANAQGQGGSPMIFPGIGGQRTLIRGGGSEFRDEFQGPAAQAAAAFFAAFEAAATEEQINAASAALEGRSFVVRPEDVEGGRFLLPIFDAILANMAPVIQQFTRQFESIGEQLQAFAAVNAVMQQLETNPVQAFADAMERASETTLQALNRLGDELLDLGTDSFSSIEAMQRLGVSVQQYNQFVFQTLANIENARRSITGSTTSTIDALRFQTMDTGGQFNFLTTRAEQLAAGLGSMTDPAQIAATVAQINQLTQQAFNLGTPEQQAQLLDRFIPFLESVEAEAQARLEAIQMEVEQRAADDRAALQAIFDQGQVAANSNVIAAETQFAAAREFGAGVGAFRSVVGSIDYITNELVG